MEGEKLISYLKCQVMAAGRQAGVCMYVCLEDEWRRSSSAVT